MKVLTQFEFTGITNSVDTIYKAYLNLGEEVAHKQDWAAVLESMVCDAYYPDASHCPTAHELAVVYNYVSANTLYADIVRGAEFLLTDLSRALNKGLTDNLDTTTDTYIGE